MVQPPRISREVMLLEIAFIAARRGTCDRLHVGAVIARESRPIAMGYVGAPSGAPHCGPDVCDVSKPCTRTIHAESNALVFAEKWHIHTGGCDIFITDAPCLNCALEIAKAEIVRVYYCRPYRLTQGIDYLTWHGIEVIQLDRSKEESHG